MSKWSSAYRDPRWLRRREEVLERDEHQCRSCEARGAGAVLQVHHIYYESGRAPWDYEDDMLVTWCARCHKARHETQRRLLLALASREHYVTDMIADIVSDESQWVLNALEDALVHARMTAREFSGLIRSAVVSAAKGGGA